MLTMVKIWVGTIPTKKNVEIEEWPLVLMEMLNIYTQSNN